MSDKLWKEHSSDFAGIEKSEFMNKISRHLTENNPLIEGESTIKEYSITIDYKKGSK